MPLPRPGHAADRLLSLALRLLLAGCLCVPLVGAVYVVAIYRDISSVGWLQTEGDFLWASLDRRRASSDS